MLRQETAPRKPVLSRVKTLHTGSNCVEAEKDGGAVEGPTNLKSKLDCHLEAHPEAELNSTRPKGERALVL